YSGALSLPGQGLPVSRVQTWYSKPVAGVAVTRANRRSFGATSNDIGGQGRRSRLQLWRANTGAGPGQASESGRRTGSSATGAERKRRPLAHDDGGPGGRGGALRSRGQGTGLEPECRASVGE